MKKTLAVLAASAALALGAETYTGVITDNMCDDANHRDMKMGSDEKCVVECVKGMNGKYVLFDGKRSYVLSDQKTPEKFAAKKVIVTGTLDAKSNTIQVDSIKPAN